MNGRPRARPVRLNGCNGRWVQRVAATLHFFTGWSGSDKAVTTDLLLGSAMCGDWGSAAAWELIGSIGRCCARDSSSIFSLLPPSGGIRPAERKRSARSLSLVEREEILRALPLAFHCAALGLSSAVPPRPSAARLAGMVGLCVIEPWRRTRPRGSARFGPSPASWLVILGGAEQYHSNCAANGSRPDRGLAQAAFRTKSSIYHHTR